MVEPSLDAVILCGGQGQRMGGRDKGLLIWHGLPLFQHVLNAIAPWQPPIQHIWLSANRHLDLYAASGLPVLTDLRPGFAGPLAGIEAAMLASQADYVLVLPCDVPQLPADLLPRFLDAIANGAYAARAASPQRFHPTISLLPRSALPSLQQRLDQGLAAVAAWQQQLAIVDVAFEHEFANLNTPDALQAPV